MSTNENAGDVFGEILHAYTRAQAIADGVLVDGMRGDLAEVSRQHYKYPVAMTIAVFELVRQAVENPKWHNDYRGVWHDILWMSKVGIGRCHDGREHRFRVIIRGAGRKAYHTFKITCGPGDDGAPVLTIMLPEED